MVIEILSGLVEQFSYLGIFIINIISTSTLFFPFPIYAIGFFVTSLGLHPLLIGLVAGLGSAVGELVGYFIGAGGRHVLEERLKKSAFMKKLNNFFTKYGFWSIVFLAFLPFPFDFIGILAGASNYNIKRFFLATLIGKTIKMLMIAYAGFFVGIPMIDFINLWLENKF